MGLITHLSANVSNKTVETLALGLESESGDRYWARPRM
jgi:hypothetical protein